MPTPNQKSGLDWSAVKDQARRAVLDQLRGRFGLTDLESRIETALCFTPADWAAQGINLGATFNLAHNLGQMLHKRVHHRAPGLDGLWFVGGGTHPGSGLPVIFLSAQTTARELDAELSATATSGARRPSAAVAV
jgi:phytoene desaturase